MTASESGTPLFIRIFRAFAGPRGEVPPGAPLPMWSGEGSVAARAAGRIAGVFEVPAAAVARALDTAAAALGSVGPRSAAAAAVILPVARLLLPDPAGSAAVIALAAMLVLALLLRCAAALHSGGERRIALRVLLLGAVLRAGAAVVFAVGGGLPDENTFYDPLARDAAACWARGGSSLLAEHPFVQGRAAYYYLLSGTYFLLGPDMAAGRVLGAGLGLLAALLAGELARAWGGARAAVFAVGVLAVHPEHAFWSATLSRDTLSTVLALTGLLLLSRDPPSLLRRDLWLAGIPVALLSMNGFLPAGALGGAALATGALAAAGRLRTSGGAAVAGLLAAVGLSAAGVVGYRWGPWFRLSLLTSVRQGVDLGRDLAGAPGSADFLPGWTFDGPMDLAAYAPLGVAFVLLAPIPWGSIPLTRLLYGPLWCGGVAVSALGIAGLASAAGRSPVRVLPGLLFVLLLLGILAVLEGNTGIVVRHRLPLTAVLTAGAGFLLAGWRTREFEELPSSSSH